jgi:hypothetical protein
MNTPKSRLPVGHVRLGGDERAVITLGGFLSGLFGGRVVGE